MVDISPMASTPRLATDASCLHQLIEAQARRTPDAVALVFEQQALTYAELLARSNQVANCLQVLGIVPEEIVGLCVERSLEMVVGILGILKAGGAYLPIDPTYPPERMAFMLGDANVALLLTQDSLLPRLPSDAVQAICLDSFDWTHFPALNDPFAAPASSPANLAYVIYTSGSTGQPKGVCIEHRQIVNYVLGIVDRFQFTAGMRHATVSTIAADLGNTVIFPALVSGGCLHVIAQERTENQALLADYFQQAQIDVLKIVPSHLAALQSGAHPEQVMPRRCLILGGEASRLDWIKKLQAMAPDCRIHNHYGPTETTVGVLTYDVGSTLPTTQSGTLPLGKPLPNYQVHLLDEHAGLTPDGEVGELYIGGRGVARGYLNQAGLTAEKFLDDRFSEQSDARLYRTGDLARRLPTGDIEFCGRRDHQVKIHGYRVELGEIEKAISALSGVQEVVVTTQKDAAGDLQLLAYIVPKRAHQPLWDNESLHILPDGLPVAHLNRNETTYIYHEIFVLQAYLRHGISINDGDCIIDAGSNIGLFTVFASRLARDLRIFAFEPNPAAFACLKANADAWGNAVTYLPHGLSNENRSAEMTFFEGLSLLSGFYADAALEGSVVRNYVSNQQADWEDEAHLEAEIEEMINDRLRAKSVPTQLRTLSSVIAEEGIECIDLLKINVEKSELDVLRGLSASDWPKIRQLVIEVDQQEAVEPIQSLLASHGFETLVEQDPLLRETALCYIYAIRPSATGSRLIPQVHPEAHLRSLPATPDEILTPSLLRKALKEHLPPYMIPSAFALLDKMPLNANGKIDRHALPALSPEIRHSPGDGVMPRSGTEKELAAIWEKLLKVDNIGVHDDFFDLGGESLVAIKVVSRIRDTFAVNLPLRNLFDHPTIAGLAEVIEGLVWLAQEPGRQAGHREEISL